MSVMSESSNIQDTVWLKCSGNSVFVETWVVAVDNESSGSPGEILDILLASCLEVYDQEVFKASLVTVVLRVVKHFGCEQSDTRERDGDLKISLYRLFSNNPIRKEYDKPSICKSAKELVLDQYVSGQKMGMK